MERSKYILTWILQLIVFTGFSSNNDDIYEAFINGDMQKWEHVISNIATKGELTLEDELELINFRYGYIAWCIANDKIKSAKNQLDKAYEILHKLEEKKYRLSTVYSYHSAFIGYKIGIHNYKAPFIGTKSLEYAKKALELNPDNAFAYIQMGNDLYFKPAFVGGSKPEAVECYIKALSLMEQQKNQLNKNWNYLNLLSTLINAHIELEDYTKAKFYCEKALNKEPEFKWIKEELYPLTLKKLKDE